MSGKHKRSTRRGRGSGHRPLTKWGEQHVLALDDTFVAAEHVTREGSGTRAALELDGRPAAGRGVLSRDAAPSPRAAEPAAQNASGPAARRSGRSGAAVTPAWLAGSSPGEAAAAARAVLRSNPDDHAATETFAAALEEVVRRRETGPRGRDAAGAHGDEAASLPEAFSDRSVLYELDRALVAWLDRSQLRGRIDGRVRRWLERAQISSHEESAEVWFGAYRMAFEHATLTGAGRGEGPALAGLAQDPATPPRLAAAARSLVEHAHYGLWQVTDPRPAPGVWLTDLVSATRRYVQLSPDQVPALVPWAVIACSLVPVEGIWRTTGGLCELDPGEGDMACARVLELSRSTPALSAARSAFPDGWRRGTRFGVLASTRPPLAPGQAKALSAAVGAALALLIAEKKRARERPVRLANTDGEPLCPVEATLALDDAPGAWDRLLDHPDIEAGGENLLHWWGKDMPPSQAAVMRGNVAARAEADGLDVDPERLGRHRIRWVRGRIRRQGTDLLVEANSRARLDALLALLRELGQQPIVVRRTEERSLPVIRGRRLPEAMDQAVRRSWMVAWVDEPLDSLGGLSPRQAAGDGHDAIDLEALLRALEHDSWLSGEGGAWVESLREEIGLCVPWTTKPLDLAM